MPGLRVLTDHEIFRRARRLRRARRYRQAAPSGATGALVQGDYVVHLDHGIGIYRGISTVTVGVTTLEVAVVEYEGGDRLNVPLYRLDQLPAIWQRLVDAGFESGHAYGKSLRTVKSCVGSTWCRYGVQDSVGLAITLELRYRGLRSPHKLKLGVSGCARECAEARGKDVGVIATADGWITVACAKQKFYELLCRTLGREDLISDPRFADFASRDRHREELLPTLEAVAKAHPALSLGSYPFWDVTRRETGYGSNLVIRGRDPAEVEATVEELIAALEAAGVTGARQVEPD